MTILVTGANGFIGAWTLKRLLAAGLPLVAFDLHPPGALVERLLGDAVEGLPWRCGDVVSGDAVDAAAAGCSAVVHLAGVMTPFCQQQPVRGAMINLVGTLNVFEAARRVGASRVVYTSSAGVFGPAHARFPEPTTHYGAFKLAGEGSARSYAHAHGIHSIGLRPFVVYGPGREVGGSAGVSLACQAAAEGQPYCIPFTGRAGMVYVGDVVDAIHAALTQPFEGAQVFNMAGEVHAVDDVIAEIRLQCPGADLRAAGEPLPLSADIPASDIGRVLPGLRVTSLRDGIAQTLAFYS